MALLDIFSDEGVIHSARGSTGTVDDIVGDTSSISVNRGTLAGVSGLMAAEFIIFTLPAPTGRSVKYWSGSAWIAKPIKMWNGSSWISNAVNVRTGSGWETLT